MPEAIEVTETMSSRTDRELLAARLSDWADKGGTAIEFGPWLGSVSEELARHFDLHVVDNFEWTADHAKRSNRDLSVGDSFVEAFRANLSERGLSATIHVNDFQSFSWTGAPVDFAYIDGSKRPDDLVACLDAIVPALTDRAEILIKHALDPQYPDLLLAAAKYWQKGLVAPARGAIAANTILLLSRGDGTPQAPQDLAAADLVARFVAALDLPGDHMGRLSPLVMALIDTDDDTAALTYLAGMRRDPALRMMFEKTRPRLEKKGVDARRLRTVGDLFLVHHGGAEPGDAPVKFHGSWEDLLQGYWLNNLDNPARLGAFEADMMRQAFDFGYMSWPSKVREVVEGCDILDIGCGPGLHGLGYLAAGARSYTGLDPIVKRDRDRVKNLTAKTKAAFGWTPIEMEARLPDWKITPLPIEALEDIRAYDLATLHNVTEHLHQIEMIFAETAKRLRKGGKILYNHHNFYSWNGHHLPPKTTQAIDLSDPKQLEMIDWGHVDYDPAPEHYIARGLNRIRLDEILELTERYFDIEVAEEIPSRPNTGSERLTDKIRARHPDLSDRDFLTQNLYCIATVR